MHACMHVQEEGGEGSDKRVAVVETSTGNKLTGEEAPLKSELEKWLQEHPGYVEWYDRVNTT